jgi:hypothetical protein
MIHLGRMIWDKLHLAPNFNEEPAGSGWAGVVPIIGPLNLNTDHFKSHPRRQSNFMNILPCGAVPSELCQMVVKYDLDNFTSMHE